VSPARFIRCLETVTGKTEFLQNSLPKNATQRVKDELRTAKDALMRALSAAETLRRGVA
jgi:hypothetical protein